jgi:DNA polymerase III subunit epsilon
MNPGQRSFDDLGTPLSEVTFCVIDLETTGGSPADNGITEIGAVKVRGGEVLGSFQTLVNPGCAIPPTITLLTGITEAMVMPAPRVDAVLPTLLEFIGADSVLVGHNVRFDLGFLNAALERSGRPRLSHRSVDTVALARRLVRDEVPDCRLGTLASRLRLDHKPSHRALDDVLATVDLLHLLIERAAAFGVMGLDDLITLPAMGNHPHAPKLRHTDDLPRSPGVYMFIGPRDDILYVGKATNLRQRVRSYFSTTETRRKVGALLRETQRIDHIVTPDPLSAAVLELRLLHRHAPRYNRQGLTWSKYCYVRLTTDEAFPRLSIVRDPGSSGLHIGPLPSRSMAQMVVEAVQTVVPLRRCTQRIGRAYRAPADATPCTSAQLGVAWCPCSGGVDTAVYARVVELARRGLCEEPELLLGPLRDRMIILAAEQRYEEAGLVRDRAVALVTALDRQRRVDSLRRAGRVEISFGDVVACLDHGRLDDLRREGQLIGGLPEPPAELTPLDAPVPRHCLDEMLCVARHLEAETRPFHVVSSENDWTWPVPSVGDAFYGASTTTAPR